MDEVPDRSVIDLEAAFGEFGDEAAQGEVLAARHARKKPVAMGQQHPRAVAVHRTGGGTARRPKAL